MRKLIIATAAAAGVLAATASLAVAAPIIRTGPPGTIIKGSIGNCNWKLQGGEQRGKVAYTRL